MLFDFLHRTEDVLLSAAIDCAEVSTAGIEDVEVVDGVDLFVFEHAEHQAFFDEVEIESFELNKEHLLVTEMAHWWVLKLELLPCVLHVDSAHDVAIGVAGRDHAFEARDVGPFVHDVLVEEQLRQE